MRAAFTRAFATKTQAEWASLLGPADCCAAPVLTVAEAVTDPQYLARHAVVEAHHPTAGTFPQTAPLYAGTTPPPPHGYRLADPSASDVRAVLAGAGFDADQIDRLVEEGVVA
jgi:alpha-methylacyl-CoA racemase